ncbi:hypothetical protein BN873_150306 [Candidatus Competibacter denitrificans Run_A_D11]|uniref:TubC N-terminal docking domain-containing protein n=2 Tax=Candidatus Competibacter TaxID=221279 RepID=W6MBU8_9GAMM|nr:hypothetical protein BN873_150306 [Candidatus Competibacter denitrificans Run_A_D11]
MALVRAIQRMRQSGFCLALADQRLLVTPADRLNEDQDAYLRSHKGDLVALLQDADTLAALLEHAGSAGLGWREGTPPEWDDDYLLAVDEVLYGAGRMVSRLGRRYHRESAPTRPVTHNDLCPLPTPCARPSRPSPPPPSSQDAAKAMAIVMALYRRHRENLISGGLDPGSAKVAARDIAYALRQQGIDPMALQALLAQGWLTMQGPYIVCSESRL